MRVLASAPTLSNAGELFLDVLWGTTFTFGACCGKNWESSNMKLSCAFDFEDHSNQFNGFLYFFDYPLMFYVLGNHEW